ncbi:hypothetical protein G9A89_005669 [Geosiphon pyriformis]|nr:hypothetical protein G9A89_005669 [Geosiphon pyriformis]
MSNFSHTGSNFTSTSINRHKRLVILAPRPVDKQYVTLKHFVDAKGSDYKKFRQCGNEIVAKFCEIDCRFEHQNPRIQNLCIQTLIKEYPELGNHEWVAEELFKTLLLNKIKHLRHKQIQNFHKVRYVLWPLPSENNIHRKIISSRRQQIKPLPRLLKHDYPSTFIAAKISIASESFPIPVSSELKSTFIKNTGRIESQKELTVDKGEYVEEDKAHDWENVVELSCADEND